ncbi:RNA polymerase sigma factor [Oceanirhabdus sp. W0125-5]|uniref:RNA polymerase sigma factor n=1 Tax=Oceanirhabdus sp. W0125-5 TaxID=2999116 RepID=UPI0022F2AC1C|nr:RNA polymerase sigma factor [Oceanirhabdus sp. W0125-5]WBW97526.1 RNA polymerase sigma factor [Oceanirhabdus sp. W0125-5]
MDDFLLIYKEESVKLLKYLRIICKDQYLVDDIFQETMMKAYEELMINNKKLNTRWFCIVAKNMYLNHCKKNNRISYDEIQIIEKSDTSNSPEEVVQYKEHKEFIRSILNCINPKYKQLILLRDYVGYSYQEIAQRCGMNIAGVKIGIFRARKSFKKEYDRRKRNEM